MAIDVMHIPSADEIRARRARLGFAPPVSSPVLLPPPVPRKKPKPVPLEKILARYRLRVNFRPRMSIRLEREEFIDMSKQKDHATARRIIAEICDQNDISAKDLTGISRIPAFIHPRQEAIYRVREETTLSSPEIGRIFGGRDHTTILYSIRAHKARMDGLSYRKMSYSHQERIDAGTVEP